MITLDTIVDIVGVKYGKRYVKASLIADNSAEVVANGTSCADIVGLSSADELAFGSDCLTTDKEFGMLNSAGVWKF